MRERVGCGCAVSLSFKRARGRSSACVCLVQACVLLERFILMKHAHDTRPAPRCAPDMDTLSPEDITGSRLGGEGASADCFWRAHRPPPLPSGPGQVRSEETAARPPSRTKDPAVADPSSRHRGAPPAGDGRQPLRARSDRTRGASRKRAPRMTRLSVTYPSRSIERRDARQRAQDRRRHPR